MNYWMNIFSKLTNTALITLLLFLVPATAVTGEEQPATTEGAVALQLEGSIGAIDLPSREISLNVIGIVFTVFVPETVDLDNIHVGDTVTVKYFAATEIELRGPTAEDLADPWTVVEAGELAKDGGELNVEAARTVRAVVTVVLVDKANERLAVKDSRGMTHLIMNVEPEKLNSLTVGQQIVVVFAEATAVVLEKKS